MKKSIIQEIYFGKRGHSETVESSDEHRRLLKEASILGESFIDKLSDAQRELYNRLDNAESALSAENALLHFTEGFKLGLLIAVECLE